MPDTKNRRAPRPIAGRTPAWRVFFSRTAKWAAAVLTGIAALAALTGNITTLREFVSSTNPPEDLSVSIDLGQERKVPEPPLDSGSQYDVVYVSQHSGQSLSIDYESGFFTGEVHEVGILGEGPYFNLPKVGLDIKVANNRKRMVYITRAVLEVESSFPDMRPLMLLTHSPANTARIEFTNDGWSRPKRIALHAGFGRSGPLLAQQELEHELVERPPLGDTYLFKLTPLLLTQDIDAGLIENGIALEEKLRRAYFEIEDLKTLQKKQKIPSSFLDNRISGKKFSLLELGKQAHAAWGESQVSCVRGLMKSGLLAQPPGQEYGADLAQLSDDELRASPHDCGTTVSGRLDYSWLDAKEEKSQAFEFSTFVHLTPAGGLGAPGFQPTGAYDVELREDASNYRVSTPLSQPVESGKADRFIIWIGARQSSRHLFRLRLVLSDDQQLVSSPITLNYFMPRANRLFLDSLAKEE